MALKKVTLSVPLAGQPFIAEIMKAMGFVEIDRVATGGMYSSESLLITYEGKEGDYHEDLYAYQHVQVDPDQVKKNFQQKTTYYSLHMPYGYECVDVEQFAKAHRDAKSNVGISLGRISLI